MMAARGRRGQVGGAGGTKHLRPAARARRAAADRPPLRRPAWRTCAAPHDKGQQAHLPVPRHQLGRVRHGRRAACTAMRCEVCIVCGKNRAWRRNLRVVPSPAPAAAAAVLWLSQAAAAAGVLPTACLRCERDGSALQRQERSTEEWVLQGIARFHAVRQLLGGWTARRRCTATAGVLPVFSAKWALSWRSSMLQQHVRHPTVVLARACGWAAPAKLDGSPHIGRQL